MKKAIYIAFLMFFIQFLIFRAMFTAFDSYMPNNKSGNSIATALELVVTIFSFFLISIVILIEKLGRIKLKFLVLILLYIHGLFHFYWVSFFEYHLFNDSESFDTSSIAIILLYFVFELCLTFFVVSRLYKEQKEI